MNAAKIEKQKLIFPLIKAKEMTKAKGAFYCEMQYDAFRRKYARWLAEGDAVFVHGLTGKPSNNKTKIDYKKIIELRNKPEYVNDNFSDFTYCLNKHEGIKISYTSVYTHLVAKGITPPLQYRKKKKNQHFRRAPKDFEGEMIQYDATPYPLLAYFGDNANYALHGAIDDATSGCVGLYVCENECSYGYFEVLRHQWKNFGIPLSDYTDRLKFFDRSKAQPTKEEQLAGEERHVTQWIKMCRKLSINHILARSPQAKGRIERFWRTVQGELPSRIIKFNLNTIEKINAYLPKFVEEYNERFKRKSPNEEKTGDKKTVWRNAPGDCEYWLCYHDARKTNHAGEFSYKGLKFQCTEPKSGRRGVDICVGVSGIWTYRDGKFYAAKIIGDENDVSESASQAFQKIIRDTLKKSLKDDSELAA